MTYKLFLPKITTDNQFAWLNYLAYKLTHFYIWILRNWNYTVLIEDERNKNEIETKFDSIKLKSLVELDLHVIVKKEFLKMLKVDYSNVGKMIFLKHKCIYNCKLFYKILKEGHKNGFRV